MNLQTDVFVDTSCYKKKNVYKKPSIIVKDKIGAEYICCIPRDVFLILPENRPVEVIEQDTKSPRKFVRKFLEFVREK